MAVQSFFLWTELKELKMSYFLCEHVISMVQMPRYDDIKMTNGASLIADYL